MKVYIVIEDDRGCGPSVIGVFRNLKDAENAVYGGHMWIIEEELQ